MRQQRSQPFPILALLLGLLIGVGGGLAYAWYLNPVSLVDVAPSQLISEDQRVYIVLVSEAYLQDGDIQRARARLQALRVEDIAGLVAAQADEAYLSGGDPRQIRAMTTLAEALGASPRAGTVFSGTSQATSDPNLGTPTATFEGMPTITPTSDATSTPTLNIPTPTATPDLVQETQFQLVAYDPLCTERGMIFVDVYDSLGAGVPGLQILVEWEGQQEVFFTGLKPNVRSGYADFEMEPGTVYTLTVVGLAQPVVNLETSPCETDDGESGFRSWDLTFTPAPEPEETPAP